MGYSGGTDIARAIIEAIQPRVADPELRSAIYRDIIEALRDADWDCENESMGFDPAWDTAL